MSRSTSTVVPLRKRWALRLPLLLCIVLAACSKEPEVIMQPGLGNALPGAQDMNVLIVSFDAMRADGMGLYGYPRDTTPVLDALAERSLVFDNAYSAAPVTPTSFAAAFTGQYPYRVFLGWQMMPTTTLAQLMKDSGRTTFGLFNNVQLAEERHFGQGFEQYEVGSWSDRQVLKRARTLLDEHRDKPFFGWVHFISPHTPYDYRELSGHLAPLLESGRYAAKVPANFDVLDEQERLRVRELYDGEMFYADDLFGKLMTRLENLGLADNTIVVITADHGEAFGEHGELEHNSLHDEVVRIPMIIHHPAMESASRTNLPYLNIDLLPTLAGMVGQAVPDDLDGLDLAGPIPDPRTRVVTAMTNRNHHQIAVERDGHKLIQICRPEFREEMFDRNTDPQEQTDRLLDDPALATQLTKAMQDKTIIEPCQLIVNSVRGKAPEELLSDEQIEQLKSLGYIQ